jgi:GNAT superfamily N-acetyltransferase
VICHPVKSDIEQMKTVWQLCFGDDRETVDCFYERCFSADECYISKENGTVYAVVQMIKCSVVSDGETLDARYMYAVCTHPDYQGRGIMSALIKEAIESERKNGARVVLCIPANERLFEFYKRSGFENGIYCSRFEYDRAQLEGFSVNCGYGINPDAKELCKKRNALLNEMSENPFVSFPEKYISTAKGWGYRSVITDSSYAFFTEDNGVIRVVDSCFDDKGFNELCFALLRETKASRFIIDADGRSNHVLKGVVKTLDDGLTLENNIYLGLKME